MALFSFLLIAVAICVRFLVIVYTEMQCQCAVNCLSCCMTYSLRLNLSVVEQVTITGLGHWLLSLTFSMLYSSLVDLACCLSGAAAYSSIMCRHLHSALYVSLWILTFSDSCCISAMSNMSRANPGSWRIGPMCFLAGQHKRPQSRL